MTIPDAALALSAEVPTARSIEVPPPASGTIEAGPIVDDAIPTPPRPRRTPAAARPTPRPEPPAPPEPEPEVIDPAPIEVGPTRGDSIGPGTVPLRRVALALASIAGLVAVAGLAGAIIGSRRGKGAGVVDDPAPVAIVEAASERPAPIPIPEPPATPDPIPVATAAPLPMPGGPLQPAPTIDPAIGDVAIPAIEEPAPPRPLVIRRRQGLGQEALRQRLSEVPEINVSHENETALLVGHGLQPIAHRHHASHKVSGRAGFLGPVFDAPPARVHHNAGPGMHVAHRKDDLLSVVARLKQRQPELDHLPWRMGEECRLDRETAEELEVQSRALRNKLQAAIPEGDTRPDADALRASLFSPEPGVGPARPGRARAVAPLIHSDVPAAIPALMQLLMAERTPVRLVLVDVLARIKGPAASKALARLATFDLAPEVREQALAALRDRPPGDSRPSFVEGLRYPWPPVADHAAEALVALEDRGAIPDLVALLDEPDPRHPRTEVREGRPVTYTRTLVQVNHLRNCLLCHAPSTSVTGDLVRGRIPTEGMPLPPPREYYAAMSPGEFVRAEVTYLRQDFSASQPVENPGPWPAFQRYDYVIFEKPVTDRRPPNTERDANETTTFPQRESALFALRELTGKDLGGASAAWKVEVRPKDD